MGGIYIKKKERPLNTIENEMNKQLEIIENRLKDEIANKKNITATKIVSIILIEIEHQKEINNILWRNKKCVCTLKQYISSLIQALKIKIKKSKKTGTIQKLMEDLDQSTRFQRQAGNQ
jgi:hypothetical protein